MDNSKGSVVLPWLGEKLSWKQQTVVLSALRGCDGKPKEDPSKPVTRRFRSAILKNADSNQGPGTFMHRTDDWDVEAEKVRRLLRDLDHYPLHWVTHFAHACHIVGANHPDEAEAQHWRWVYENIARAIHFNPELDEQMTERLADCL